MPDAARLNDATGHGKPLSPGTCSTDVNIGKQPAWRATPKGTGSGLESASDAMKSFMDAPSLDPASTPARLSQVLESITKDVPALAQKGASGAPAAVTGGFSTLVAANIALTATYTAAAAAPGAEPAARQAYTEGIKAAAAAFANGAFASLAGATDVHVCPQPSGPSPHGAGLVTRGSSSVNINKLPAARKGDSVVEAAGGSNPISAGCTTVRIGG